MTTEELRKWHRARLGDSIFDWAEEVWDDDKKTFKINDPFPETIDGAASAMPPGWEYWKIIDDTETGFTTWYWAGHPVYQTVKQLATGDEVHDRYALAKYAWEAMADPK